MSRRQPLLLCTVYINISKVLTFQPGYKMIGISLAKSAKKDQYSNRLISQSVVPKIPSWWNCLRNPLCTTNNKMQKQNAWQMATERTVDQFVKVLLIRGHKCHKTVHMDCSLLYIWHMLEHTLLASVATTTKNNSWDISASKYNTQWQKI